MERLYSKRKFPRRRRTRCRERHKPGLDRIRVEMLDCRGRAALVRQILPVRTLLVAVPARLGQVRRRLGRRLPVPLPEEPVEVGEAVVGTICLTRWTRPSLLIFRR
uniref:(northern house mosquito) hypothetical protein n=1 Tax=Culex pipiens TaxID=7175 RepID=A0A8D8I422_CULPI